MTTTTMHFGPEWMRTKQATPARTTAPSPPLATPPVTITTTTTSSSYSALVASPNSQPVQDKYDLSRPFRFSKDDILRIYKEGGGRGGLGLEVERWEGIVREVGSDPVGLKEMSEGEKKSFAGSLNSEVRRRQSTDYLAPLSTERPKLGHLNSSGPGSPMRERMGNFVGRRRDSTDQPPLSLPRKQSLSSMQAPLQSPRDAPLPSPRIRIGSSGFDGGVLDGAWTSKRRAAEAAAKAGGKVDREPEKFVSQREVKEEEVEISLNGEAQNVGPLDQSSSPRRQSTADNGSEEGASDPAVVPATVSVAPATATPAAISSGPPPGLDMASLEWSYLDPQGQVQGPFRADVMQKWFDEGYFTPELMMKRTHLESEWTSVRVLQQIAVSTPVFLTPMAPPRPPEPQPQQQQVDYATLNSTRYDTEVQRPLTTALNARLHDGSNPSDSPMSSYSNPHFSNNSPEPSAFGGRAVNGGGLSDMSNSYSSLNSLDAQRQSPARDPPITRPHIGSQAPIGGNGFLDSYSMNGYGSATNLNGSLVGSIDVHSGGLNGYQHSPSEYSGMSNTPLGFNMTQSEASAALAGLRLEPRELQPRYANSYVSGGGSPFSGGPGYSPLSTSAFIGQQDMRTLQQSSSPFPVRRASGSTHMMPQQQQNMQQSFLPQSSIPTQASLVAQDPLGFRRPGPFDVNYPTSQNTIVQQRTVTPSQASSYGSQPLQNGKLHAEHSAWYASSQGVVPEGWGIEPSNLTVANLGHHNQLLNESVPEKPMGQTVVPEPILEAVIPALDPQDGAEDIIQPPPLVPNASVPAESSRSKTRRKPSATTARPAATEPTAVPIKPPTPTPLQPESKQPAWNVDDEKNGSGAVMSLREIQEAEAKKVEARKAAERERAATRAAAAAASVSSTAADPVQAITASWGLPTSHAGSTRTAPSVSKESLSSPSQGTPTSQTPVWTAAAKPVVVKKTMTMKEIQEEEEKRKKLAAKEKETMAAAARRGYADTTTKTTTVVSSGGAWTTVGSGGKTSAAAITAPPAAVRPPLPASSSTKPSPVIPTAPAAPIPTRSTSAGTIAPRTVASVAAAKVPAKVEESPAPSTDFLKWLGDALKGLNSSVNLEEIASMLLQFPVDPDSSTIEIISDLIYANSTTLDGRRFAAEFVSKRKASTKASPGTSTSIAGKLSIADVVKTQPKPAQNEWSGFKVVNKKKKGGRV